MATSDFFELTAAQLDHLNQTEKKLYDFVTRNMDEVKLMSVRQLARTCYVSPATVFRFVNKLGFSGFKEFIAVLKITDMSRSKAVIPDVMRYKGYREDYLKNLIESVRVIRKEQVKKVHDKLKAHAKVWIFGTGLTMEAARYIEHLFLACGCNATFAYEPYEMQNAVSLMTSDDLVFMLSYKGNNPQLLEVIDQIKHRCSPLMVSITRSDNNMVQLMTELNFYIFADEITYNGFDLTSRVAMIAVIEIILYELFSPPDENSFHKM